MSINDGADTHMLYCIGSFLTFVSCGDLFLLLSVAFPNCLPLTRDKLSIAFFKKINTSLSQESQSDSDFSSQR